MRPADGAAAGAARQGARRAHIGQIVVAIVRRRRAGKGVKSCEVGRAHRYFVLAVHCDVVGAGDRRRIHVVYVNRKGTCRRTGRRSRVIGHRQSQRIGLTAGGACNHVDALT
ncbi:MAG: hypothetical protein EPGJADBJ_04416 [Saprospiraceae bacterium]|nr:hypothetical protein [Saprospiraceae bacterium]